MPSELYEKVLSCPSLPSLPAVAVEVLRITRDPNTRLPEIARVVQNDPGLSAKILKTVNSSLYGLKERCTRIDRALGFMGMNTVKSIVLGLSVVDSTRNVKGAEQFDMIGFWRKTIFGAAAARQLARDTRACDPDEAFTAGLFQDIGMLAAVTALNEEYATAVGGPEADPYTLCERETEKLGFDHTEIGGELARKWALPKQYIDCIRHHHAAGSYEGEFVDIVRVVALGGIAADTFGGAESAKSMARLRMYAEKWFDMPTEAIEPFLKSVCSASAELARVFEKNVGQTPDVASILVQAQEMSIELQLAVQREAEQLREANQSLAKQSLTDPLTGIGNRRRFDDEMASITAGASASDALSVLLVDADKFKSVNDNHGHPAGDAVLIELASRLAAAIGDKGLVCRFGGEEFAAILPGCDSASAAALGEIVRAAMASKPIDASRVPGAPAELNVTISVGVATRPAMAQAGAFAGASAGQLLKAADEAMYAAKQAGRNCVRIAGTLPDVAQQDDAPCAASAATNKHVFDPSAAGGPPRIMIVEDDPLAAALLKAVLSKQPGFEVVVVERTDVALREVKESVRTGRPPIPAMIVCDLGTANVNGIEFVRDLKQDPATRAMPVVIISAAATAELRQQCLDAGARVFVSKAELARDLSKWVARMLAEARPVAKAA